MDEMRVKRSNCRMSWDNDTSKFPSYYIQHTFNGFSNQMSYVSAFGSSKWVFIKL